MIEVLGYLLIKKISKYFYNLKIVCENFPPLFNQYGIILVNPIINKELNITDAKKYVDWILTDEAKNIINSFKVNNEQLFFYNHH